MRTIEITLYQYNELSEKAKEKALLWYAEHALDYDWYESVYDDAESIGLKITSFDTYYNKIDGRLTWAISDVINSILSSHGEMCDTYKTAIEYKSQFAPLWVWFSRVDNSKFDLCQRDCIYDTYQRKSDELDELSNEFLKSLLEDYLVMLKKEYEYVTSKEYMEETIIANEYEFTEQGELY